MRETNITGVEKSFSADEFIVSKTNERGIITYANDVFLRVADYTLDEVLNKPHNLIRHPWMPRCVFKLLWTQIKARQEIFAYVVNRTKHGDHYWVFAHVTPSYDSGGNVTGYHSNRRLPSRDAINQISEIYKMLRDIELAAPDTNTGMEQSFDAMLQWVNDNGGNYDALIHTL
ncbi:MAG: PAS domain-containing protein [Alphaproteobacteria bacterium]